MDACSLNSSVQQPLVGIKKWCHEYNENIIEFEKLKALTEEKLKEFDQKAEQKAKETDGVPDEDGWIKVVKKSKRDNTEIMRKGSRKKELLNFYRFQIRESKMDYVTKLRKKFEEDKQKIELLKSRRKFKPY